MIKFFRKIRQNLLSKNRLTKYLIYALGEIILVVIGILIALSINNWNQKRLSKIQVATYLENIALDLKSDIALYDKSIRNHDIFIANIRQVLESDEYKQLATDTIHDLIYRTWGINTITKQTFEKIQSTGLQDILGTPEIDKAVNEYYSSSVAHFDYFVNWDREMTNRDDIFWSFNNKFETGIPNHPSVAPIAYEQDSKKRKDELIQLIESTIGRNHLRNALDRDAYGTRVIKGFKSKAESLLELIEHQFNK